MNTHVTTPDLHTRLETLGRRIDQKREDLERNHHLFHERDHLTAQDLKSRYVLLQHRMDQDVDNEETHGRHVTNLERAVRVWLDTINAET